MADESTADDGALHALFAATPLEAVVALLAALARLAAYRGPVTADIRARAQALADDPTFGQADHPAVRRILEAP